MINIYDTDNDYPEISTIFLNIPTPFKRGDLLISNSITPFRKGILQGSNTVFCLDFLITWKDNLEKRLAKGCLDDSDMMGDGYYICDGKIIHENLFEYDSWEYYNGRLEGLDRILKGVSSLLKSKIDISIFLKAYDEMREEEKENYLYVHTNEGLELVGFNKENIKKIKRVKR